MAKAPKRPSSKRARPPRRAYGELGGSQPRLFRPSTDVDQMLDDEVERTGKSQSAIIDEGLRRAFWRDDNYQQALERNFGGRENLAIAYLIARSITGIEHEMRQTARDSAEVREQVACVLNVLVASLFGRQQDDLIADTPAQRVVAQIKTNLSEGLNMCWPLSDTLDNFHAHARPRPPLRPSLDELRDVASFFARGWCRPERF